MSRPQFRRFLWLLGLAAMLGCGHTEPFAGAPVDRDQPFSPTPPIRLTLNRGPDRRPAWLPDGSAILYSTQHLDIPDHDVCLARLLPTGGSQRQLSCSLTPNSGNITDASESAAPAADGQLAFVAAISTIGAMIPDEQAIALGSVGEPSSRRTIYRIPYSIPGGRLHQGVSQLRWLGPDRLVYLGEAVSVYRPCQFCVLDTLRSGLDAVVLDLTAASPAPAVVPGTDYASGVSPGANPDEVYYTLAGDSRVYRRLLSTGDVSVIHDFGAAGFARDLQVVGSRMVAVVGGRVSFTVDPSFGPTQWDSGGTLHLVDLQNGNDLIIDGPDSGLFRRPQLSPSGTEIVAEVYPLVIASLGAGIFDTTVSKLGDLYHFGQP